jgi:hypothetical protein
LRPASVTKPDSSTSICPASGRAKQRTDRVVTRPKPSCRWQLWLFPVFYEEPSTSARYRGFRFTRRSRVAPNCQSAGLRFYRRQYTYTVGAGSVPRKAGWPYGRSRASFAPRPPVRVMRFDSLRGPPVYSVPARRRRRGPW